jgi:hypothetical protein
LVKERRKKGKLDSFHVFKKWKSYRHVDLLPGPQPLLLEAEALNLVEVDTGLQARGGGLLQGL